MNCKGKLLGGWVVAVVSSEPYLAHPLSRLRRGPDPVVAEFEPAVLAFLCAVDNRVSDDIGKLPASTETLDAAVSAAPENEWPRRLRRQFAPTDPHPWIFANFLLSLATHSWHNKPKYTTGNHTAAHRRKFILSRKNQHFKRLQSIYNQVGESRKMEAFLILF